MAQMIAGSAEALRQKPFVSFITLIISPFKPDALGPIVAAAKQKGVPVIVDDIMYEGGENSWWFAVKLNRGYDAAGNVTVDPQVVYQMPAWTDELTEIFGRQHSVENSTVSRSISTLSPSTTMPSNSTGTT